MTFGSFRLNTLSAAASGAPKVVATGGTITTETIGGISYKIHTFNSSSNFVVTAPGTVDVLVVGGGGGGGGLREGSTSGGGGGGFASLTYNVAVTAQTYSIVIGAGGAKAVYANGYNGNDSSALGKTATGGSKGGNGVSDPPGSGRNSPGGGGGAIYSTRQLGGTAASGYGNPGGSGGSPSGSYPRGGGGGGGMGGSGVSGSAGNGGNGGAGITYTDIFVTGTLSYAGGGGGGSYNSTAGIGIGLAGGGNGARNNASQATAGGDNTGSGGGGGSSNASYVESGAGGSGVVKIRYLA